MFRRKKSGAAGEAESAPAEDGEATTATATLEADEADAADGAAEAEGLPTDTPDGNGGTAESEHRPEPGARPGSDDYGPGYVGEQLPPRVWMESVLDNRPPPSREELERRAAADFQAAIAPSLQGLREAVPDASSPDDARRALEERESEIEFPPDPEGERMKQNDIYKTEATIHHRIQKQMERPRGRVGWGRPWEPPAGLGKLPHDSGRRSLPRGGG